MAALHENAAGLSEMVTALAGVEICKEPWRIYYDETENCRSIAYRNGAIADARTVERTFILGGIAILGEGAENELSARIESFAPRSGEMKARTVLGGSDDFARVLRRRETTRFLESIDQPGIAVHYHSQDNLYYAIVDIVDSMIAGSGNGHMFALHRELKNALYLCARIDPVGFLENLAAFGFPNVPPGEVRPFCEFIENSLLDFLETRSESLSFEDRFFIETLRQMARASSRSESLALLKDNPPDTLVEGFSDHYQQVCLFFPKAFHCFDDETHVSMDIVDGDNYDFVDSESNLFVQLSDVWVGLLSRCFRFLGKWADDRNPDVFAHNPIALENLKTIRRPIDRAADLHPALVSSLEADCVLRKRFEAFDALCGS
ncbi:MAG: DUF3800 domain-containing protein [Eggerthellaceae bacterium]